LTTLALAGLYALSLHDALPVSGFNPDNGIGDLYARLDVLPGETRDAVRAGIDALYAQRPSLAMVNSDKGITNLHVPSDVIVDASDRKSTRLNSSHVKISYAGFC